MQGFISIGSNIDKDVHIPASLEALALNYGELLISSIYESEPVGFVGNSFYNLVVGFQSDLPVKTIAEQLRKIETDNGRTRSCKKFSARTLDLDLIIYGDLIIDEDRLQIPRDEITRYAFVLEPLAEIAPDFKHPVSGETFGNMWLNFDKHDLKQQRVTPSWLS